jgi:ParB/RepB/Spo0J family partition protein
MKIPLNEIKPSPNPIRKTWDEQNMQQLTESLQTEGQVEPIGVSTNGKVDEYIIVWGHRRVEAARRANWDEIDCVIVPTDEVNNLIQAGIENLAGEDMSADDKAEWAFRLMKLGLSEREIARKTSIHLATISTWIIYRQEKNTGVSIDRHSGDARDEGVAKINVLVNVLGDDLEAKKAVAAKSSNDQLSKEQTREVAKAYRDAPTPEVKAQVLKTPIISRDTSADILRRSVARVELETGSKVIKDLNDWEKEQNERKTVQAYDLAVKSFIDLMRLFRQEVQKVPSHIKGNKYSPEAARYVSRKLKELIDDEKTASEYLDGVK